MHVTLSMLASSASDNSDTQKQLLQVLGRANNLENLEKYYDTTLTDYEVGKISNKIMSLELYSDYYRNMTSAKYTRNVNELSSFLEEQRKHLQVWK